MIDNCLNREELLRRGEPILSFTRGRSMRPLLREGKTQVYVEPICGEPEIGDMLLYQRGDGRSVLHRVIGMDEEFIYTRGDNCASSERILRSKALGVATEIRRRGNTISVTDRKYRAYVRIWMGTASIRCPLLRVRDKAKKSLKGLIRG